jgi:hypothetical protein
VPHDPGVDKTETARKGGGRKINNPPSSPDPDLGFNLNANDATSRAEHATHDTRHFGVGCGCWLLKNKKQNAWRGIDIDLNLAAFAHLRYHATQPPSLVYYIILIGLYSTWGLLLNNTGHSSTEIILILRVKNRGYHKGARIAGSDVYVL